MATFSPAMDSGLAVPHRVMDEDYMAKQLPYLQERAPIMNNELLEFPSNAPPTLPTPPLYPGEVLRMQQHRVICTDIYSEPLVGVVYLTNFRIIFNGTPVSAPEVYDIVKEMQFPSTRRESKDTVIDTVNHSPRTYKRRQKFQQDPRSSKFYIGEEEEECDSKITGGGVPEDRANSSSLPLKVMKKITTMRRSTEASIKNVISENKQGYKSSPKKGSLTPDLKKSLAISLPLSHPSNTEPALSASAPNAREDTHPPLLLPIKLATLPRPGPPVPVVCQHQQHQPSSTTSDSGFVSVERELDSVTMTPPTAAPADSVFLPSSEVDFEKPPGDPLLTASARKRVFNRSFNYRRPDSLIAIESDSDSDTVTDRYFSSICEDDDEASLTTTSPECASPQNGYHSNLDRDADQKTLTRNDYQPVQSTDVEPRLPSLPHSLVDGEPHPLLQQSDEVTPQGSDEVREHTTPLGSKDRSVLLGGESQTTVAEAHSLMEDKRRCISPPEPPKKPPRRKNKLLSKSVEDDINSEDISSSIESNSTTVSTTSSNAEESSPIPVLQWNRTQSDEKPKVLIKPHSRRSTRRLPPPPPPPPSAGNASSHGQSTVTMETMMNRTQPVALVTPPKSPSLPNQDGSDPRVSQTSSLYVNCPSANSLNKRFTLSAPPNWSFNWSESSDKRSFSKTWSNPRMNAKIIPYFQYSHSSCIPISLLHTMKPLPSVILEYLGLKLPDGLLLVSKNFISLKLYLHPQNTFDAVKLKELLENTLAIQKAPYNHFAFKYRSAIKLPNPNLLDSRKLDNFYSFEAEVNRMGILNVKIQNSQIWRVTNVTKDNPDLCRTYPEKLVVLLCTPDVDLIRGASVYQEGRFPVACWMNPVTESVLLRASATKSERGQQGVKLPVDEAILHAIRGCNRDGRLCVFTEKAEPAGFHDPTKLTTDEARMYYYHNCNFVNSVNPPTFKSVRHSFNKLQAMILNNVSDDEFHIALDSSRWLSRISELLETSVKVCQSLTEQSAHVLVCYGKGWDRTTQITSLTQLLCDPYYRTMCGFQVLIQKEWLWFSHPFGSRNGLHKGSSKVNKEDGPVFLQWLDCVHQVMRQCPLAFEFNENLLLALVEHSYSDQFGTFLMNSERERKQCFMVPDHYHQSVNTSTVSLWSWVAMMNASSKVFYNPLYHKDFHSGVIFPKYYQTCLELWRNCFEHDKVLMELQENGYSSAAVRAELTQLLALYQERIGNKSCNVPLVPRPEGGTDPSSSSSPSSNPPPSNYNHPKSIRTDSVSSRTKLDKTVLFSSIVEYLHKEGYDPSICHHITISGSTCQGYLVKEGAVRKNWKRRWFVLDYRNEYFAYFETSEHFQRNENPKGLICLDQVKKVSLSTKREHLVSNLFQIRTPTRIYNIKAPSIISLEIWMACLKLSPSSLDK